MKGKLHKTELGWMVKWLDYNDNTPLIKLLPIHHYSLGKRDFGVFVEGKEVEFDIVDEISESCNNPLCDGDETCIQCYIKYAKLINRTSVGNDGFLFDAGSTYPLKDDLPTTTSDLIDSAIWSLPFDERIKCWDLIEKLVEEEKENTYTEEQMIDFAEWIFNMDINRVLMTKKSVLFEQYIKSLKQPKKD